MSSQSNPTVWPSLLRFLRPWRVQKDIMQVSLKSVQHFLLSTRLHQAPKAETLLPHQDCEGLRSFFYHRTNSCSFGYQSLTNVAVIISPEQLKSTFFCLSSPCNSDYSPLVATGIKGGCYTFQDTTLAFSSNVLDYLCSCILPQAFSDMIF